MALPRTFLKLDMQAWPEHLLTLLNSAATITGIVGAALVLLSLGLLYFTGNELNRRAAEKNLSPEERASRTSRLVQTEKALAVTQKSEKEIRSRLSKTDAELAKVRGSQELKSSQLARTEADLAIASKAAKEHESRATKAESQLAELRRAEEARSQRLAQTQVDLANAQKSAKDQAAQLTQLQADLQKVRASEDAKSLRLTQTEADLAAAQKAIMEQTTRVNELEARLVELGRSDEEKTSRLSQTDTDLEAARKADQNKTEQLAKVETDLARARESEQAKTVRISQLESDLSSAQRAAQDNATRVAKLENDLVQARKAADEAKATAGKLEAAHGPRAITPEQRLAFLEAVRGQSRGRVIVSAIFFNKETHEFGRQLSQLLKDAGFTLLEPEPLNFFTTGRPPSGIRIGFKSENNEPAHVATLLKGFRAIGMDPPMTTLVNSDADDVVEIQVTPRE